MLVEFLNNTLAETYSSFSNDLKKVVVFLCDVIKHGRLFHAVRKRNLEKSKKNREMFLI